MENSLAARKISGTQITTAISSNLSTRRLSLRNLNLSFTAMHYRMPPVIPSAVFSHKFVCVFIRGNPWLSYLCPADCCPSLECPFRNVLDLQRAIGPRAAHGESLLVARNASPRQIQEGI